MKRTPLLVLALIATAAIAFILGHVIVPDTPLVDQPPAPVQTVKVLTDSPAEKERLAQQLAALQELYDALLKELQTIKNAPALPLAVETKQQKTPAAKPVRKNYLAEIKEKDPKKYEEIQKRMEEFRTRVAQANQEKVDFLNGINLDYLTPEGREIHQAFTEAVQARAEIMAQMGEVRASGENPSQELIAQMRETSQSLFSLQEKERENLTSAALESFGITGEDGKALQDILQGINQSTTNQFPGVMGGRGGKGGGRK